MRIGYALLFLLVFATSSAHAIVGSTPDAPTALIDPNIPSSPFAGVGSVEIRGNNYSGTLIGLRYVITAAHVVDGVSPASLTFNLNVDGDLSNSFAASAIYINPGYHGFKPGPDGLVHNDLAIIELSQPVPANIPIYSLYTWALIPGSVVALVGYGNSGDDVNGSVVNASNHIKRVGFNAADVLLQGSVASPDVYVFDFDGSTASANFTGGTTLGSTQEATLGSGDSGSAALINVNGSWQLVGVNSFVLNFPHGPTQSGVFGTGGGGQLISGNHAWIKSLTQRR